MDAIPWTVTAFRKRRRETWISVRLWLLLLAIGLLGFQIPFWLEQEHVRRVETTRAVKQYLSVNDETEGEFTLGLISLVAAGIAAVGITLGVRRHYRCPRCETIPMGSWSQSGPTSYTWQSGVSLLPSVCRNCGARLR
jgi:hypothetical protein